MSNVVSDGSELCLFSDWFKTKTNGGALALQLVVFHFRREHKKCVASLNVVRIVQLLCLILWSSTLTLGSYCGGL